MNNFSYKEPYIFRDEDNKKWCVRYSIKYVGEKNYTPLKEYGRMYFDKSLNKIADLKLREKEFQRLLLLVEMDLKAGIDKKRPAAVKEIIQKEIKESTKKSYDECLKLYCTLKGYDNPIPKKEMSAVALKTFHKNQFRPFLEKKGLLNDISAIAKSDLQEFMDGYYFNADPAKKWSNNTFNNKKGFLSSFFATMVSREMILENPVKRIQSVESETTQRFTTFTKEERDILFTYLDKKSVFIATIARLIYYAYIRESELARLKVSDFDLEKRQICIHPDNAKGQKDKLVRWVKITKPLNEALKLYLSSFENQPDWYIFGKKYRPSQYKLANHWQYLFLDSLRDLQTKHPGRFNREGLSLYSLKHSGVTHFIEDNAAKFSTTDLYRYVQSQCRHESFEMTQRYLKKLEINIETVDLFDFL